VRASSVTAARHGDAGNAAMPSRPVTATRRSDEAAVARGLAHRHTLPRYAAFTEGRPASAIASSASS
jgi:hypothetical protein